MAFVLSAFADEIGPSLSDQIRLLRHYQIGFVEYRSGEGLNVSDHTLAQGKEVRKRFEDAGIGFSALGSPLGKIDITADFAPHLALFRHTVDLALAMGAPAIRLFSFFMPEGDDPRVWRNKVMDQLSAFAEANRGSGVKLLHENEKAIYGDTPERCRDLLDAVPELSATYDFSNFVQCGCDNRSGWRLLKDRVVYFHLKDSLYTQAREGRDLGFQLTGNAHRPLGQGDGCVREILADALASGFRGFASLEPHLGDEYGDTGEKRFSAAAEAARALLTDIGGLQ